MASLEEIRQARLAKIETLKQHGMEPYPARVPRDFDISVLKADFASQEAEAQPVSVAGRIMAVRGQGAILFAVIFDGTERIQAIIKKDVLPEELFSLFTDAVDIGDFISVTGVPIVSQRGEQSIMASSWLMAAKSLLPLPEKWHGLQDVDERYRKRYLDLLMDPDLRDLIEKKSKFWDVTRQFMKDHGFLEVETPTLETTTGGAEATPFKTHHNDYDLDVYLRISVGELWQKRLMAAGFPRTFEIGRAYRNEGTSPEHAQEFTNMEFYWSFADFEDGMNLVRDLYIALATEVFGGTKFTTRGHTFDLADEWKRIDYSEEVLRQTGVDVRTASEEDMMEVLTGLGVKYEGSNRERLTDTLWKFCRKNITGPAFLINHPTLVAPLSKANAGGVTVQRFQPILAGSEVGNGYSELNDPLDQRERFEEQKKLLEGGDTEAMMADYEFVEMLEYGMPPTCGFGFGERLFAFFADKPLRELQTFPLMRPFEEKGKKDKETYVATAIVNIGSKLESWQIANTVAHLSAAFGARSKKNLFKFDSVKTSDEKHIKLNIQHAIMIKKADSANELRKISDTAQEEGLEVSHFTRDMLETTNDNKVAEKTKSKKHKEVEFLGVLVFGPKSQVDELTKSFQLYS
jgi:lysyl-tRNA synthetase, class II